MKITRILIIKEPKIHVNEYEGQKVVTLKLRYIVKEGNKKPKNFTFAETLGHFKGGSKGI